MSLVNLISTGIEHLITQQKTAAKMSEQLGKRWKEIRTKINQMLLSGPGVKSDEHRQYALALDTMPHADRADHIKKYWGAVCYDKVVPLLQQLATVESQLLKAG